MSTLKHFAVVLALAAATVPADAYYHFVHYVNGAAVPEKYDLTQLPNQTVTFFVSETGPTTYNSTDTFNSVLSQIRQATTVWNGVSASAIRVAFGGLENGSTPQNTPGADVVFEDLPPGLYGYGGPTSTLSPVTPANGAPFIPVVRSTVHLNRNLTILPPNSTGPSYTETFFMTVVHEMGHALGLQHVFTSATMSQATTRATTLSHPLDADDIAGVATLYPTASFSQFGTITGRITNGGNGVHLSSVVAIRAGWGAVSAFTNPDGTFEMDGVPPGQYFVYAHTIPPDANIIFPVNPDGSTAQPSAPTNALFYPGTTNLQQATPISVQAGQSTGGINIALSSRSSVEIYDAQIYGYFDNNTIAVDPAFVDMLSAPRVGVTAYGVGLGANGQAPGLNVQVLGGSSYIVNNGVIPFQSSGTTFIGLYIGFDLGAGTGPQHLVFTTPDYMYVLPDGFSLTQALPPTVTAVANNGDGTVTVTGTNWASDSLIYFDGLPALNPALNAAAGSAIVTPPVGASGQTSVVSVYNSDGQNSQLVQSAAPVTYSYGASAAPAVTSISPASLPAGAEAMVDIMSTGFAFAPGQTAVGFGTTDVVVRSVFVLGPNHVQVDVSVAPGAALSNPDVSVVAGFQIATAPAGFQITAAVPGLPAAIPVLTNALPGLTGSYAGAIASLYGSNLAAANATPALTIGGQAVTVLYASPTQINLQIPSGLAPGPATLNLNNGLTNAYPVDVNIDTPPASIGPVQNSAGTYLDGTHPAHPGDLLMVTLNGFAPAGQTIALSRVQVGVGGALYSPIQITSIGAGAYQVSFLLGASAQTGASQPLIVYLDGRSSYPATITVASP